MCADKWNSWLQLALLQRRQVTNISIPYGANVTCELLILDTMNDTGTARRAHAQSLVVPYIKLLTTIAQCAIIIENVDSLQFVSLSDLLIYDAMRRGQLHSPCRNKRVDRASISLIQKLFAHKTNFVLIVQLRKDHTWSVIVIQPCYHRQH